MKEILSPNSTPLAVARFDPARAREFADCSTLEQTRRDYARVVREFFAAIGNPDPRTVAPPQVRKWGDCLKSKRQKPATVSFKLSVIRAFFSYIEGIELVNGNPADAKLVLPPAFPEKMSGRALAPEEVRKLLAGPDKQKTEGARDYASMLGMLRLGLRVSEMASLRSSDLHWSHDRWTIRLKVKGGRERTMPLPDDIGAAIKDYLKLDEDRRRNLHSGGGKAYLFQPITNYRMLEFDKPLSIRIIGNIITRWCYLRSLLIDSAPLASAAFAGAGEP